MSDEHLTESTQTWTFLTNHAHVLFAISQNPDIRIRYIASLVGITERAVVRIVGELAEAGFIKIDKIGRQNQYSVTSDVPLRHPLEQHRSVNDLLEMLSKNEDHAPAN